MSDQDESNDGLLYDAWNLIANAYHGNWDEDPEWKAAAIRWRDAWHRTLSLITVSTPRRTHPIPLLWYSYVMDGSVVLRGFVGLTRRSVAQHAETYRRNFVSTANAERAHTLSS